MLNVHYSKTINGIEALMDTVENRQNAFQNLQDFRCHLLAVPSGFVIQLTTKGQANLRFLEANMTHV